MQIGFDPKRNKLRRKFLKKDTIVKWFQRAPNSETFKGTGGCGHLETGKPARHDDSSL